MAAPIWTTRRPGEIASSTRPHLSEGEHATVLDPSLSPDWLAMPDDPNLDADLRGRKMRVIKSVWFPLAPNPVAVEDAEAEKWLDQRTRWHVTDLGTIAVAEVIGHGWVCVDLGEERKRIMLSWEDDDE